MNKKVKNIFASFVVLLMLFNTITSVPVFAKNVDETTIQQDEIEETIDSSEEEGGETTQVNVEDVLTETEQSTEKQANAPALTEQQIEEHNFLVIGQTESGAKIYSTADKETTEAFISNPQGFQIYGTGTSSGMLTWNGIYSTPRIYLEGIGDVYCIEPYEAFPSGEWYDAGTWLLDAGLDAIMFWGFPHNYGGQHGLSDDDAYLRTFVALNAYIGTYNRSTVQSYGDEYVNMLLSKADAEDVPTETYTVHSPNNIESYFNEDDKRLETDLYNVTGAVGSSFWLENLPSGFFVINEDGNEVSSLTIPAKFRVATKDLWYTDTVNFDVKTTIAPSASIKFSAQGVQTLMGLGRHDPLPGYATTAIFKAATGNVEGTKTHVNDTPQNYPYDFSKYIVEAFDSNNTSVGTTAIGNDGKWKFEDLLIGDYTYQETINDNNIVAVKGSGTFTIKPGETTTLTADESLVNKVASGKAIFSKVLNNDSTESYPLKYSDYGVNIQGTNINKDYWLSDANYLETDQLRINVPYQYNELVRNDKGTVKVKSSGTFTLTSDGQIIDLRGTALINEVAYASIEYTKKDGEWLTPILKPSTFGLYEYDTQSGTVGTKLAESQTNFLSAKGHFDNIQIGYSGSRTVIIKELVAPGGYYKDEKGIIMNLTTGHHKTTIEVDYMNTPEKFFGIEVAKIEAVTGEKLAGIPFVVEELDADGNVVKEIDRQTTNTTNNIKFAMLRGNDENNNIIEYQLREIRDESNKYFVLADPIKFTMNNSGKVFLITVPNVPKKLNAEIGKVAEDNIVGLTAEGATYSLYNNKDEIVADDVTVINEKATVSGLTYKEITDDMYFLEKSVSNPAFVLDKTKYYLPNVDWNNVEDGDTLHAITPNDEPVINKIKKIAVEGLKQNEYLQPLKDVEFDLFAEDTIIDDGLETEETIKNVVENLTTSTDGKFITSYYPIYMFNGVDLSYMQEVATLENLVLITQRYNVPIIDQADYDKYDDQQILPLLENNQAIINYNLRINIGGVKMNEDDELIDGAVYKMYDANKDFLAETTTKNGILLFEGLRFDVAINNEDPTAEYSTVYIREVKTSDDDKYALDYVKYYLPNLYGKQDDYKMGDTIWLSTEDNPFVNKYLRGEALVVKVDENNEELPLANATFKFERLTGQDIENGDTTEQTTENNEELNPEPTTLIDVKQSFELTTDAEGKIDAKDLLYGDWCATEIDSPDGYILPVDKDGIPNNKLCFTINAKTQKIVLKFYNQKEPEILVETGNNKTQYLLIIAALLILVSLFTLVGIYLKRNNLFRKISKISIFVLVAFFALGTMNITLSATTTKDNNIQSIVERAIDPTAPGSEGEDPDTLPDTPPTSMPGEDITGNKPDPTAPVSPVGESQEPIDETSNSSTETTSETLYTTLTSAGEKMTVVFVAAIILVISFIVFLILLLEKKFKKEVE